jgi:hypothetical protein
MPMILVPIVAGVVGSVLVAEIIVAVGMIAAQYAITSLIESSQRQDAEANGGSTRRPGEIVDALNTRYDPMAPQIGLFGRRRVGGNVVFRKKKNNKLYMVIVIAGDQCHDVSNVYVNDKRVELDQHGRVMSAPWFAEGRGSMWVNIHRDSRSVDRRLAAAFDFWDAQHLGVKQTYATIMISPDPAELFDSAYAGGVPDFTFDAWGFPCYDPRDSSHELNDRSTWEYTNNSALHMANYLIHDLGMGLHASSVDWESVKTAAIRCGGPVELRTGDDEARYKSSTYWTCDMRHEDVISRIGATMAGGIIPPGDKWRVYAEKFNSPTYSVTEKVYLGEGLSWSESNPLDTICNGVRGTFASFQHGYELKDFPPYQNAEALALDGNEYWLDLSLDYVTSHTQAQRLSKIAYMRARYGTPATLNAKIDMLDVVAGDVIAINDPLADLSTVELASGRVVGATYRVMSDRINPGDMSMRFELQRELPEFSEWDALTEEQPFAGFPVMGEFDKSILPPGFRLTSRYVNNVYIVTITVVSTPTVNAKAYHFEWAISPSKAYEFAGTLSALKTSDTTLTFISHDPGTIVVRGRTQKGPNFGPHKEATIRIADDGDSNSTNAVTASDPLITKSSTEAYTVVAKGTGDIVELYEVDDGVPYLVKQSVNGRVSYTRYVDGVERSYYAATIDIESGANDRSNVVTVKGLNQTTVSTSPIKDKPYGGGGSTY